MPEVTRADVVFDAVAVVVVPDIDDVMGNEDVVIVPVLLDNVVLGSVLLKTRRSALGNCSNARKKKRTYLPVVGGALSRFAAHCWLWSPQVSQNLHLDRIPKLEHRSCMRPPSHFQERLRDFRNPLPLRLRLSL